MFLLFYNVSQIADYLEHMVLFDAVSSGDCVISNGRSVTHLSIRQGFKKMFDLSDIQSSFCFANVKGVTVPATGFVNNVKFLRATESL